MAISQLIEQLRRIVVSGSIKEDTGAQFLEQMTALEYSDHTKPITVYVDTYGGSVDAALLMYDVIKTCSCPINTVGMGKVMSAGVLLLAAGDKGYRYISPNTRVMIHEVSSGVRGTVSEMDNAINESRRLQEVYIKILAKNTGKSLSQIKKDITVDKFMTAQEAIKYGIADKVLPSRRIVSRKKASKRKAKSDESKK